jgi:hypothetical protein
MVPIHRVQHLTSTDEIFGKRSVGDRFSVGKAT